MVSIEEKIKAIEEEIRNTDYNKATQHHIGKLKAKLAQLREELIKKRASKGKGFGFAVKKSGHATAVLIGSPSVGKSTLLNQLTNAESRVEAYDFTTLDVIPGVMEYKELKIQILDIPGIITGASIGKGRGREVLSIARNSDLILLMIDPPRTENLQSVLKELYDAGIRLDQERPNFTIKKTIKGGIKLVLTIKLTRIDEKTVRTILNEYGIHSAEITINEDLTEDRLIDGILGNSVYLPSVVVLNKIDTIKDDEMIKIKNRFKDIVAVSAMNKINLEELREKIFNKLNMIRVYMKPRGKKPDFNDPLIVKYGSKIEDVCDILHKEFKNKFKYAQVWGKSARFPGQRKGLNHVLEDGDVLTIIRDS